MMVRVPDFHFIEPRSQHAFTCGRSQDPIRLLLQEYLSLHKFIDVDGMSLFVSIFYFKFDICWLVFSVRIVVDFSLNGNKNYFKELRMRWQPKVADKETGKGVAKTVMLLTVVTPLETLILPSIQWRSIEMSMQRTMAGHQSDIQTAHPLVNHLSVRGVWGDRVHLVGSYCKFKPLQLRVFSFGQVARVAWCLYGTVLSNSNPRQAYGF